MSENKITNSETNGLKLWRKQSAKVRKKHLSRQFLGNTFIYLITQSVGG